jgi:hypothetical protein
MTVIHWWSERDPQRRQRLKSATKPNEDEDERRRLTGGETIDQLRDRLDARCKEIQQLLGTT